MKTLTLTESWAEQAACVGQWETFDLAAHGDEAAQAEAKTICARCPARAACTEFAIVNVESGMWGGLTDDERGRLRAHGRTAPHYCDKCDTPFASRNALAAHTSHRHSKRDKANAVPTACPDCGQVFKSRQGMANHRAIKHRDAA